MPNDKREVCLEVACDIRRPLYVSVVARAYSNPNGLFRRNPNGTPFAALDGCRALSIY